MKGPHVCAVDRRVLDGVGPPDVTRGSGLLRSEEDSDPRVPFEDSSGEDLDSVRVA